MHTGERIVQGLYGVRHHPRRASNTPSPAGLGSVSGGHRVTSSGDGHHVRPATTAGDGREPWATAALPTRRPRPAGTTTGRRRLALSRPRPTAHGPPPTAYGPGSPPSPTAQAHGPESARFHHSPR